MSKDALRRQIVKDYFASWITEDVSLWRSWFDKDVLYYESVGTAYRGAEQLLTWQKNWIEHGKVLSWDISEMHCSGDTYTVLWQFCCVYDGEKSTFIGVSVIDFNDSDKIILLREFAAEPDFTYPYA